MEWGEEQMMIQLEVNPSQVNYGEIFIKIPVNLENQEGDDRSIISPIHNTGFSHGK